MPELAPVSFFGTGSPELAPVSLFETRMPELAPVSFFGTGWALAFAFCFFKAFLLLSSIFKIEEDPVPRCRLLGRDPLRFASRPAGAPGFSS